MDARQFLNEPNFAKLRIEKKRERLEEWQSLATSVSTSLSPHEGKSDPNIHKLEETVEKIEELERDLLDEIQNLTEISAKVAYVINQVGNVKYRTVLELQFLNGENCNQISKEMGYIPNYIRTLSAKGIAEVEEILKRQFFL